MLAIGLTGGIGSGKSTVADLFAQHGVAIIDADIIAHQLTAKNTSCYQTIVAHFGASILNQDETLNRIALASIIFNNDEQRRWLEQQLHPKIQEQVQTQMQAAKGNYCIAVIPLLIENHLCDQFDRILLVDTSLAQQKQRAIARNANIAAVLDKIIERQCSREQRLAVADDVITNEGSLDELKAQVTKLHLEYSQW